MKHVPISKYSSCYGRPGRVSHLKYGVTIQTQSTFHIKKDLVYIDDRVLSTNAARDEPLIQVLLIHVQQQNNDNNSIPPTQSMPKKKNIDALQLLKDQSHISVAASKTRVNQRSDLRVRLLSHAKYISSILKQKYYYGEKKITFPEPKHRTWKKKQSLLHIGYKPCSLTRVY